ncbi:hypothetical protein CMI37_32095 [Candidatus Pacearchaeota archaeon]|nr:hypothetical protein [Candidatus Pacearchaeota archaeon]|tara:strand:+ start:429 stop:746 length:318 start_codon:yes stop_codon:yes gene_type:complete
MATRERGTVYSATLTTTDETSTVTIINSSAGRRGCTFFVHSASVAGTAKVYYIEPDGTEREMDSQPYTANTLLVMDYDFTLPQAVLKLTMASGSSTVVNVEGINY